jgi:hypothetical protein
MSGYGYIGHFQGAIKLKGGRRGRHEQLAEIRPIDLRMRWNWIFWGLMGVERKILLYLQIDSTRRAISGLERCYRQYKPKES